MSKELENRISELKKHLYPNGTETTKIDKVGLQKSLFLLLRECLKVGKYEITIGSYKINVNPQYLSVVYQNPHTTIEVSNNDVFYETIRDIPVRYFVINDKIQDEYPSDTPIIKTLGLVINVDGIIDEVYDIELYTNNEDNVRRYLNLKNGFTISRDDDDPYSVSIKREITPNDPFTKIESVLTESALIPVLYDYDNDKYIFQKETNNNLNYKILLPSLDDKKEVVSFLYSSMVEFYTKYI